MVNVRMITGDHFETARFVAHEAGIISRIEKDGKDVVMTGQQFRDRIGFIEENGQRIKNYTINPDTNEVVFKNIDVFQAVAKHVRVIARATDEDKLLLVEGIKQGGGVPLVSGEQIADARALKSAKVGVAMGTGCLVAKANADLVILNNEFSSIYNSIMWGRTIYENVRKFVQFQLTMNISLLVVIFISACSIGKPPFKVIQLLWMNLVMDIFAACAICTEPFVHKEDTESLPRESRKARIIRPVMWRNILPQALYQIVVMIILIFGGQAMFFEEQFDILTTPDYLPPKTDCPAEKPNCLGDPSDKLRKDVACFHTFMLMNIFNMINCRVVSES